MKEATILKGYDILKQIEHAQKAKTIMQELSHFELRHRSQGSLGSLYPYATSGDNIYFNEVNIPQEVREQINSEVLKFISRVNKHIDNYEYELKRKLEEIEDEKA